jgi:enterochelin esterase family protein
LVADVEATNRRLELLWLGCGTEDFLLERNDSFAKWLTNRKINHTYRRTDGGHSWLVWRKYLAEFLPMLFR